MPEPFSLMIPGGLFKAALVKSSAAIGTKTALMHTAIATEGAVGSATTVGGAATAVGAGGKMAYKIAKENEKNQNRRSVLQNRRTIGWLGG